MIRLTPLLAAASALLPGAAHAERPPEVDYAPAQAPAPPPPAEDGAIFRADGDYQGLAEGHRAARVGDLVTVVLVERARASSDADSRTGRDSANALSAPGLGGLGALLSRGVNLGGSGSFKGQGRATQGHALDGEITVAIAEIRPNGIALLRGEKRVTTVQGEDWIRLTGLARLSDITPDNRVASVQLADARVEYAGDGAVARSGRPGWLGRFFSRISPF